MNIVILGSGGREDALAKSLAPSMADFNKDNKIYVIPGNAGIFNSININWQDPLTFLNFLKEYNIEMVIAGTELPSILGVGNLLKDNLSTSHITYIGPLKEASKLESSKIFAKNFMSRHQIPTPQYWHYDRYQELSSAKRVIDELKGEYVLKYDGLAAGKGVYLSNESDQDSDKTLKDFFITINSHQVFTQNEYDKSIPPFLIEKKHEGPEVSITAFFDGKDFVLLLPTQDHKRLFDSNLGPNTGGMGAIGPVPFLTSERLKTIEKKIIIPTFHGFLRDKIDFKGILYFGILFDKKNNFEPLLLEYNVRLGDPEAQVILSSLMENKVPLINYFKAIGNSSLHTLPYTNTTDSPLVNPDEFFLNIVLTTKGYAQEKYILEKNYGSPILGLKNLLPNTSLFYGGVKKIDENLVNYGGRVLSLTVMAKNINLARELAYHEIRKISFKNSFYRKDIGIYGTI